MYLRSNSRDVHTHLVRPASFARARHSLRWTEWIRHTRCQRRPCRASSDVWPPGASHLHRIDCPHAQIGNKHALAKVECQQPQICRWRDCSDRHQVWPLQSRETPSPVRRQGKSTLNGTTACQKEKRHLERGILLPTRPAQHWRRCNSDQNVRRVHLIGQE